MSSGEFVSVLLPALGFELVHEAMDLYAPTASLQS
jgi:hypothetical protein